MLNSPEVSVQGFRTGGSKLLVGLGIPELLGIYPHAAGILDGEDTADVRSSSVSGLEVFAGTHHPACAT